MEISQQQINQARKKHGNDLYLVEVFPVDEGGKPLQYLLKSADRKTISAVGTIARKDQMKATEVMLNSCLILGDKEALKNDKVFFSVAEHLEKINEPRKSTLKKI